MAAAIMDGAPRDARARDIPPPNRLWLFAEGRGLFELGWFYAARSWLVANLPRGQGQPVLVLPGLGTTDASTAPMRALLKELGYPAHGWRLGRNKGLKSGLIEEMIARVDELHDRYGGKRVSLVGWSLGGIYAREIAKSMPEKVRVVVTLGSPFTRSTTASHARKAYEWLSGEEPRYDPRYDQLPEPPPVPTTSIYSRTDGIVHWQASRNAPGKQVENIEVPGAHIGLGHNPIALYALFDRLSQPEGKWAPFDRTTGIRPRYFRDPDRD
jgi:pimeloyl-ACP methyl ester carboxylesterase